MSLTRRAAALAVMAAAVTLAVSACGDKTNLPATSGDPVTTTTTTSTTVAGG